MLLKIISWFSGHRCQGIHRKSWCRRHRWYWHGIPCPGWSRPYHYHCLVWWRQAWQHGQGVRWLCYCLLSNWHIVNVCEPVFVLQLCAEEDSASCCAILSREAGCTEGLLCLFGRCGGWVSGKAFTSQTLYLSSWFYVNKDSLFAALTVIQSGSCWNIEMLFN